MEAPNPKTNLASRDESPTILIVGRDPLLRNLEPSLVAHGLDVETAGAGQAVEAVVACAPDLLLLVGDAAHNGGSDVLQRMAAEPNCSVVPVLVVSAGGHDHAHKTFRQGVLGTLGRNLGCGEIAKRVARTVEELPERAGEAAGQVGEATLGELLNLLSGELRSGVLSVETEGRGQQKEAARIVLRAGRPVGERMDAFVERASPRLANAEHSSYRFEESSCGRLDSVPPNAPGEEPAPCMLPGRRVLVLGQDRQRTEALAQELRALEATVVAASDKDVDLERARSLDPEVLIIRLGDLEGPFSNVADAFRQDLRMRWASVLVVPDDHSWLPGSDGPRIGSVAAKVAELTQADRDLSERALAESTLDLRLEVLGPSRTLRVLASTAKTLRLSVHHPRAKVEIDLGGRLIMGAAGQSKGQGAEELSGIRALAAFLALGTARVHVEERSEGEFTDLMSPVDLTLAMASDGVLPLKPSIPPQQIARSIPLEQVGRRPTQQLFGPEPVRAVDVPCPPAASPPRDVMDQGGRHPASAGRPPASPPMPPVEKEPQHVARPMAAPDLMLPPDADTPGEAASSEAHLDLHEDIPTERFSLNMLAEPEVDDEVEYPAPGFVEPRRTLNAILLKARASFALVLAKLALLAPAVSGVRGAAMRGRVFVVGMLSRTPKAMALARGPFTSTLSRAKAFRPSWRIPAWLQRGQPFAAARNVAGRLYGRISQLPRNAIFAGIGVAALLVAIPVVWALSSGSGARPSSAKPNQGVQNQPGQHLPGQNQPGQHQAAQGPPLALGRAEARQEAQPASPSPPTAAEGPAAGQQEHVESDLPASDEGMHAEGMDSDADGLWADAEEQAPGAGPSTARMRRIESASQLVARGHKLRRQGRLGMAEAHYLRALERHQRYPRALVGLVKVHLQRKDAREAVRWGKKLVRRKPGPSFNHLLLGDAYALDHNLTSARKHWRIASRRGNRVARQRLGSD